MEVEIKLPKLYDFQREILNAPQRMKIACIARQAGKTTVAKTMAIKELIQGKKVLWISPVFAQVQAIYSSIKETLSSLIVKSHQDQQIDLITNGQILFKSADSPDTLRSYTFDLIVADEFAFMDEEVWKVIRPTLARRQGKFLAISTPNGFNFFNSMFVKAQTDPDWYVTQRDYTCCPDFDIKEIDRMEREMSPGEFRAECLAEFVQAKGSIFKAEWLDNIMVDQMPGIPQRHCIAVDPSLGRLAGSGKKEGDWQAVVYLAWVNEVLYADCFASRMPLDEMNLRVKQLWEMYKPEFVVFEANGFQEVVMHNYVKLFQIPPPVKPMMNKVNKVSRISRLSTLLSRGQLKIINNNSGKVCFGQLADFPNPRTHDDIIDAITMGWEALID